MFASKHYLLKTYVAVEGHFEFCSQLVALLLHTLSKNSSDHHSNRSGNRTQGSLQRDIPVIHDALNLNHFEKKTLDFKKDHLAIGQDQLIWISALGQNYPSSAKLPEFDV